jgi:hypothetical protein
MPAQAWVKGAPAFGNKGVGVCVFEGTPALRQLQGAQRGIGCRHLQKDLSHFGVKTSGRLGNSHPNGERRLFLLHGFRVRLSYQPLVLNLPLPLYFLLVEHKGYSFLTLVLLRARQQPPPQRMHNHTRQTAHHKNSSKEWTPKADTQTK